MRSGGGSIGAGRDIRRRSSEVDKALGLEWGLRNGTPSKKNWIGLGVLAFGNLIRSGSGYLHQIMELPSALVLGLGDHYG